MTDIPLVISGREDRLGARLKNMLYAWQFAKIIGAKLIVTWQDFEVVENVPFDFFDFFSDRILKTPPSDLIFVSGARNRAMQKFGGDPGNNISNGPPRSAEDIVATAKFPLGYSMTSAFNFLDPQNELTRPDLHTLLTSLPLNSKVKACLSEVLSKFDLDNATAIHIRRGDIIQALEVEQFIVQGVVADSRRSLINFVHRFAPDDAYHAAISEKASTGRLAFFSDDETVRSTFSSLYGDRAIHFVPIIDRYELSSPQKAFVELLILMRLDRAIGANSAFLHLPALLGRLTTHDIFNWITFENIWPALQDVVSRRADAAEILQLMLREYCTLFRARGMGASKSKALEKLRQLRDAPPAV